MPDDWAPRLLSKEAATPPSAPPGNPPAPPMQTIIVKADPAPPSPIRGWRFVPERDSNNLIVEIIATPIIE